MIRKIILFILMSILIPTFAWALFSLEWPKFQAWDNNGDPLSGGLVYTYEIGTTTPKTTYSDSDGSTANANPVVLDSRGEAYIYVNGPCKIIVKDSDGTTIDNGTIDNIATDDGWILPSPQGTIPVYSSGTTSLSGVTTISGNSVFGGVLQSGVSAVNETITGKLYVVNLTEDETLSGNSLYGAIIGNEGSATTVTATFPTVKQGMSFFATNSAGQASGQTIVLHFNTADTINGITSWYSAGSSAMVLSGTTLGANVTAVSFVDGTWSITGVTGEWYKNKND